MGCAALVRPRETQSVTGASDPVADVASSPCHSVFGNPIVLTTVNGQAVAKTAQQILDDFIREVQLEKGQRLEISELPAWLSILHVSFCADM